MILEGKQNKDLLIVNLHQCTKSGSEGDTACDLCVIAVKGGQCGNKKTGRVRADIY